MSARNDFYKKKTSLGKKGNCISKLNQVFPNAIQVSDKIKFRLKKANKLLIYNDSFTYW